MLPNDVRKQAYGTTVVETWTLVIFYAASRNCRNAFGMESDSWNRMGSFFPKALDPRQRSKNRHFLLVAAEGPPLNGIPLVSGKFLLTRELMQVKER